MPIPNLLNEIISYITDNFSNEVIIAALATLVVSIVKLIDYKVKDSQSKSDNMHNNWKSFCLCILYYFYFIFFNFSHNSLCIC